MSPCLSSNEICGPDNNNYKVKVLLLIFASICQILEICEIQILEFNISNLRKL